MLATIVKIKEKFHYTAKMNNYLTQSEKTFMKSFCWQVFRILVQNHCLSRQMAMYYRYFQHFCKSR